MKAKAKEAPSAPKDVSRAVDYSWAKTKMKLMRNQDVKII